MLLKYKLIFLLCLICADALVLRSSSSEEDSDESGSDERKGKKDKKDPKNRDKWDRDWRDKWEKDWNKDKDKDKKVKFECPSSSGIFSDPNDCERYYICVMNKAKSKKCDRKYRFDMFRKACLPKIMAVCDDGRGGKQTTKKPTAHPHTKPTSPKDQFRCPAIYGKFPHPEECAKYYECYVYNYALKTCPENTLFDGVKKECKPESKVHCGSRRRPTTQRPSTHRPVSPREKSTRYTELTSTNKPSTHSHSTRENTRSTRDRISTIKSTPREPTTLKITSEEPTTLSVTTEEATILETTAEDLTTTEVPTTPEEISTTEIPTTVEEITSTEVPTTVEEITTTEAPTTVEEITSTEVPTTVEEITTTEAPTTVEEITSTEVPTTTTEEPTGPPETNCDEDDLDCIIKETGEVPRWFKCPDNMGSFPHPSSPKLFIFCKNKKPKVKKCGQDLIYNDSFKTCVSPK